MKYAVNFDLIVGHVIEDQNIFEAFDGPLAKVLKAWRGEFSRASDKRHLPDSFAAVPQTLKKSERFIEVTLVAEIAETLLDVAIRRGENV